MRTKFISVMISAFLLISAIPAVLASPNSAGFPVGEEARQLLNSGRPGAIQTARLGDQEIYAKTQTLRATYDFSVLGGASGSTYTLKDPRGGSATIPSGAVIKQVIFDVLTAVSNGSGSTQGALSFGVGSAVSSNVTNLKAATSAWAVSEIAGIPVGTAVTAVKIPGATPETYSTVKVKITGQAATAGKIDAFIEYYIGR